MDVYAGVVNAHPALIKPTSFGSISQQDRSSLVTLQILNIDKHAV